MEIRALPPVCPPLPVQEVALIDASMLHAVRGAEQDALRGNLQRLAALGEMTAAAVHDFNNLLQVVVSALRVIEGRIDPERDRGTREIFAQGISAAQRAALLSRRLLSYGTAGPDKAMRFELGTMLRGALPVLHWISGSRIDLRHELHDEPLMVKCSPHGLEKALLNLAANARDAMGGAGVLTLRSNMIAEAVPMCPSRRMVAISFSDTGCGMSEAVQRRAFDRYFTTKSDAGSGIGLAAVREFARSNGGDAWLRSHPGLGTTVTIALPIGTQD